MYVPPLYQPRDPEEVAAFIGAHPFATLVSQVGGRMVATHIPLLLGRNGSGQDVLMGHVSKGNPQWRSLEGQEVLAIFSGPHAYISSSWYNHPNVPTWNYAAVHVYGKCRLLDAGETYEALRHLTDTFERDSEKPVSLENLPTHLLRADLRGLVAFELTITEVEAAFKFSQNRDDESYHNIVKALEARGDDAARQVAEAMRTRRPSGQISGQDQG